jgi:hypothetical protein
MTEDRMGRDETLAVIDRALSSGEAAATDPLERVLEELALALEAESPIPDEDFVRLLDVRVAEGFPRAKRWGRWGRVAPWRRIGRRGRVAPHAARPPLLRGRALALTGAATSLLVVIAVALGLSTGDEDPVVTGTSAERQPAPAATPAPAQPAPDLSAQALIEEAGPIAATAGERRGRQIVPGERGRQIERSAQLTLAAPGGELDEVADSIVRVTDRHRGFVLRSSVSTGDETAPGGQFELRIPADSLQAALRDLSRLGHVRARTQSGEDVTPAFVSITDRLSAARAERRGLLRRLERATSDEQVEAIKHRLTIVSLRIDRIRGELRTMRERTDYAAVAVTLTRNGDAGGAGGGGTGEALDDALGLLEGSLALALRALGVLIPLGLIAGLGWLGARSLRRRRREAVLE